MRKLKSNLKYRINLVSFSSGELKYHRWHIMFRVFKRFFGLTSWKIYFPSDINDALAKFPTEFFKGRGYGYWSWKIEVVKKEIERVENGDWVLYCDTGVVPFVDLEQWLRKSDIKNDLIFFELPLKNKPFVKKYVENRLEISPQELDENHLLASYFFVRKTEKALKFIDVVAKLFEDVNLLNDDLSVNENKGFYDTRHDQSVLSIIARRHNAQIFADVSQFGLRHMCEFYKSPIYEFAEFSAERGQLAMFHFRQHFLINLIRWFINKPKGFRG